MSIEMNYSNNEHGKDCPASYLPAGKCICYSNPSTVYGGYPNDIQMILGHQIKEQMHQDLINDPVNHPKHYTMGKIEVIEAIEDWKLCMHLGNAVKYIARADHKGNQIQDLEKAVWYINRKIQLLKETK